MSQDPAPTLGQRIDAVLEPLYAEAEQHRATLNELTQQQQALQQQIDAATQGLGTIESRMAEVVRAMAQQDPVMAAVVGQQAPTQDAAPPQAETPEPQAVADEQPQAPQAAEPEPESPQPVDAVVPETPTVELCPEADAEAVGEAAALLDAPPTDADAQTTEPQAQAEPQPEVDLAAAAERAAAAAKKLREKAAAKS